MFDDIGRVWEAVIAILLAVAGGFARLLNIKDDTKFKWSRILSELFISGFSGLMVLMFARASGLSGDWLGVAAGMSGWVGPRILDLLTSTVGQTIGITTDSIDGDDAKKKSD